MRQLYLGNTSLNQVWLGNTKINSIESYYNTPNIFIGSGSTAVPNASTLQSLITGANIISFSIVGDDVVATAGGNCSINDNAFENNTDITYISSSVITTINAYSFANNPNLTTINLPNCTVINASGFYGCDSLSTLNIPNITAIASETFRTLSQPNLLTSVSLPKLRAITGGYAFATNAGVSNVTSYNFPNLSGSNAIGGSPANNLVFQLSALNGSITVPSFYSSSNAGSPDGDLQYLAGRGWTINYI